jgi:soluble lytic murein transglycosylase
VLPELLYGVARQESAFYPAALSRSGALGLFQFIPSTFNALDKKWSLLEGSGIHTYQEYLLDPDRSIELGGRWFHEELLPKNNGSILGALVEHHAGGKPAVGWSKKLRDLGRWNDVEYSVERIPDNADNETRLFVIGVLRDMSIITAAGVLREDQPRPTGSAANSPR